MTITSASSKLLAPYISRIFQASKTSQNVRLFPGWGPVSFGKFVAAMGGEEPIVRALNSQNVTELCEVGKLKASKAKEICSIWKQNQSILFQFASFTVIPKEWEIKDVERFHHQLIENPFLTLQRFNTGKEARKRIHTFLQARNTTIGTLLENSPHYQVLFAVKSVLTDSVQICETEVELMKQVQTQISATHSMSLADLQHILLEMDPLQEFAQFNQHYYLKSKFSREGAVAHDIAARIRNHTAPLARYDLSAVDTSMLSESQVNAVKLGLQSRVFLLTGGPGTGKTFILGKMLRAWEAVGTNVVVCTPTARGANNLKSVALAKQATTVHHVLGAYEISKNVSGYRVHSVECDVFVLDEATLLNLRMMEDILKRLPVHATLVLMGDKDQLPSIESGNVFGDLLNLDSEGRFPLLKSARLTEFRRFHSGLSELATAIKNNSAFSFLSSSSCKHAPLDRQISWIPLPYASSLHADFVGRNMSDLFLHEPNKEAIQALVFNGVEEWNRNVLKPLFGSTRERTHQVGDRVMHLINDASRNVVNGEIGVVVKTVDDGGVVVQYGFQKLVRYTRDQLNHLASAYAMSIHKAQGCEFDVVVLVVSGYPKWTKEAFYTACTRAKRKLVIFSSEPDLKHACTTLEPVRRSNLCQRIAVLLAEKEQQPHVVEHCTTTPTTTTLLTECLLFLQDVGAALTATPAAVVLEPETTVQAKSDVLTCSCHGFRLRNRCIHVDCQVTNRGS